MACHQDNPCQKVYADLPTSNAGCYCLHPCLLLYLAMDSLGTGTSLYLALCSQNPTKRLEHQRLIVFTFLEYAFLWPSFLLKWRIPVYLFFKYSMETRGKENPKPKVRQNLKRKVKQKFSGARRRKKRNQRQSYALDDLVSGSHLILSCM